MRIPSVDFSFTKRWTYWILGCALVFFTALSNAQDFLAPERAFAMQARQVSPNVVAISYRIADGYYMYRDRIEVPSQHDGWQPRITELAPGVIKYDPTFDQEMALFYGALEFMLELPPWPTGNSQNPLVLNIVSQGCADAGLCYPPMTSAIELVPEAEGFTLLRQQAIVDYEQPFGSGLSGRSGSTNSFDLAQTAQQNNESQTDWVGLLSTGSDTSIFDALISESRWKILALFFGLGVLLAFTPCVLPMIPILSAVIIGQGQTVTRLRGLALASAYVAGMSIVYTLLGVLAGITGVGLAAWLQTPFVLTLFAALLAILALAMFDVISVEMPASVQTKLAQVSARLPGGSVTTAAAMGAISALIVGPCVAAPLAGALLYISQTGDVILGGSSLFLMAWGMGIPLLIVGASAGSLLPRAGAWMSGVKGFFGVLLLGTAWWMVSPVLAPAVAMFGWAVLLLFSAVLLGAFEPIARASDVVGKHRSLYGRAFRKTVGLLLAVLATIWLIGLGSGSTSLLRPLENLSNAGTTAMADATPQVVFQPVRSISELDRIVSNSTKPVMLDFYADWCVSCKEMEAFTFSSPEVAQKMQQFTLLKADVTANNADDRALLRRFNLFGPPGIMFFEPGGQYREDVRVIGFQNAERFSSTLDRLLRTSAQ